MATYHEAYWVPLGFDVDCNVANASELANYSDDDRAFHLVDAKIIVSDQVTDIDSVDGVLAISDGATEIGTITLTDALAVGAAVHMSFAAGKGPEYKFDKTNELIWDVKARPISVTSGDTSADMHLWIKIWES